MHQSVARTERGVQQVTARRLIDDPLVDAPGVVLGKLLVSAFEATPAAKKASRIVARSGREPAW